MPRSTLFLWAALPAALIMLFTTSSCRKVYDYVREHPDANVSVCHITKLIFGDPTLPNSGLQLGVTYNAKGNPLSLTELNPGFPYETTELFFRYDKFDKLSDFMYTIAGGPFFDSTLFPNTSPFIWHKYAYPHPDIVVDTVLEYDTGPLNGPSPIAKPGVSINIYKFNAEGKMIAAAQTSYLPNQPPPVFNLIPYDARGNRDLSAFPNFRYDSTINVYRTNKAWQLAFVDYSRNNPVFAHSPSTPVNTFGLPTRLPVVNSPAGISNFFWYGGLYTVPYYYIEYACQMPKGPVDY